jgi:hypothetical protein
MLAIDAAVLGFVERSEDSLGGFHRWFGSAAVANSRRLWKAFFESQASQI